MPGWANEQWIDAPAGTATVDLVNVASIPVPPDAPLHAAGVHRATVWSVPDVFVKVTVAPAGMVTAAGEKQNRHAPVPDLIVTTASPGEAAARNAAACCDAAGAVVVDVTASDGVVDAIVVLGAGVELVVLVVAAGAVVDVDAVGAVVVVSNANAAALHHASATTTRHSTAAGRRMIDPPSGRTVRYGRGRGFVRSGREDL